MVYNHGTHIEEGVVSLRRDVTNKLGEYPGTS